jgi:hypothetical protein
MNYKTIEHRKLILSKIDFIPSMQGGYYMQATEIIKYDFEGETKDQQKIIFTTILKQLDCSHSNVVLNKIYNDLNKYDYTIFKQSKQGLKTELLKTFSLKIEKTTSKQFNLTI